MTQSNQYSNNTSYSNISQFEVYGLHEKVLERAISAGLMKYLSASKLAPLNAGGSMASFAIIEAVREQLLGNGLGWSMLNQKGQCLTNNAQAGISIIATSGDKDTGIKEGYPCTKNGKGSETKNQVRRNMGQTLSLFEEDLFEDSLKLIASKIDKHELWVLLYYFDYEKKEVRYELSLPVGFKDVGTVGKVKVSEWRDRLFFTPVSFDSFNDSVEFDDEVDFIVTPKR